MQNNNKARNRNNPSFFVFLTLFLGLGCLSANTYAELTELFGTFDSNLEERSAIANQNTYSQLKASGCTDTQRSPILGCTGDTFVAWGSVRELVHTANEITSSGPTLFSLGLDLEGLGFTLRWTAGEEFSAHGNMSDSFIGSQLSGLASRISALKYGGSRFSFNEVYDEGVLIALRSLDGKRGGGASADPEYKWSPWGSFLNFSYIYGDREPTEQEDAFDFSGTDINGGIDYRLSNNHVVGLMVAYQEETLEFDSSLSIVDGGADMTGYSFQPFYLYQSDQWYFTTSLGFQFMSFEMDRSIRYPSLNPNVGSADTVAVSETDASAVNSSSTLGYVLFPNSPFTIEPYFSIDFREISVDGYIEDDIQNEGFNFVVGDQEIESLETAYGLKFQYVLTPSFGVFIPYIDIQFRLQHEDDSRDITAYYFNAEDGLTDKSGAAFTLPTDDPDSSYQIITIGLSSVIRGARQSGESNVASGGIQAFFNYRTYQGLDFYQQTQITGGLRYEF